MPPQSESAGDAPDLRAYLAPIWRWKWVIVAITILAAGVTYALTVHEAKTYTSTARLLVQNADPAASVASSVTAGQTLNTPTPQALANVATQITGQVNTASVYHLLGGATGSAGTVAATPESTSTVD